MLCSQVGSTRPRPFNCTRPLTGINNRAILNTSFFSIAGMSPYTMGLTTHTPWGFKVPTNFGVHHVMNPNTYKGIYGGSACRDSPSQALRACDCTPGKLVPKGLEQYACLRANSRQSGDGIDLISGKYSSERHRSVERLLLQTG